MTLTDTLALYGALAATVGGAWQVFEHVNRGPKLSVSYGKNMVFAGDGKIGTQYHLMVTVRNRGTENTTITHVTHVSFKNWFDVFRRKIDQSFVWMLGSPGQSVPFELTIGGQFTGIAKQTPEFEELSRTRIVYLQIHHTFADKPRWHRLRPIAKHEIGKEKPGNS